MDLKALLIELYARSENIDRQDVTRDRLCGESGKDTFVRLSNALKYVFDISWDKYIKFIDPILLSEDREKYYSSQLEKFVDLLASIYMDLNKCAFLYYYVVVMHATNSYDRIEEVAGIIISLFNSLIKRLPDYKLDQKTKAKKLTSNLNKHEQIDYYYNEVLNIPHVSEDIHKVLSQLEECVYTTNKDFSDFSKICLVYNPNCILDFENNLNFSELNKLFYILEHMYRQRIKDLDKECNTLLRIYDKLFVDISDDEFEIIIYLYELEELYEIGIFDGKVKPRNWAIFSSKEKLKLANLIEKVFGQPNNVNGQLKAGANDDIVGRNKRLYDLYFNYFGIDIENEYDNNRASCMRAMAEVKVSNLIADLNNDVFPMVNSILDMYKMVRESGEKIDDWLYGTFEARSKSLYKAIKPIYEAFENSNNAKYANTIYEILLEKEMHKNEQL